MTEETFLIDRIPAVLYGEPSQRVYLFVHGQCGHKEEGLAFAEIACPAGHQVLAIDLPEHGERQSEEKQFNPWTVVPELRAVLRYMESRWGEINVRANSIGAHFSMLAFAGADIHKALFVSPILNMERLISDMMQWAGVTAQVLQEKGEIVIDSGQTLSWDYLTWERENPTSNWCCPTAILYAGQDNMTSRETVEQFSTAHGAAVAVMDSGEHWFHTPEQLAVLQAWENANLKE